MNVVFLIFNRPEQTRRVAAAIAKARPTRLLVVADGPRSDHPEDYDRVAKTRRVIDDIAWPCEVLHNYSEVNLACRRRVSTGLDWAFSIVEDAIILEDDTLPDQSFFPYCTELLDRYRQTKEIACIGGYQFFPDLECVPDSYYFSIYGSLWGWATWRRAWLLNDDAMVDWPALKKRGWPKRAFPNSRTAKFFEKAWDTMLEGFNTWDYAWYFAIRQREMLCIVPRSSLVENIGFGGDATHTTDKPPEYQSRKASRMNFPMRYPAKIVWNSVADKVLSDAAYPRLPSMAVRAIKHLGNRHFYGKVLRRLPWIWGIWVRRGVAKKTENE